jgi:hypothetical protein
MYLPRVYNSIFCIIVNTVIITQESDSKLQNMLLINRSFSLATLRTANINVVTWAYIGKMTAKDCQAELWIRNDISGSGFAFQVVPNAIADPA